jgi:hypothetical protein
MTTDKKPWFLVMRPEDANRPGSQWVRAGAASRGKVVAVPIAPAGWFVLFGFVFLLSGSLVAIWAGLVVAGLISVVEAIVLTVLVIAALVTALVMVIRARTTRLPPGDLP